MSLRTIDLSELDEDYTFQMSDEEYRAELQNPRSERRGLSPMPADMCMSPEDEERFTQYLIDCHQINRAKKARALYNASKSNCL